MSELRLQRLEMACANLQNQINNIIRTGTIFAVDHNKQKVRVNYNGEKDTSFQSGWLSFTTEEAGLDKKWNPPDIGETVVIVSPYGIRDHGIVIKSLNTNRNPAPSTDGNLRVTEVGDHVRTTINRSAGHIDKTFKSYSKSSERISEKWNESGEFSFKAKSINHTADSWNLRADSFGAKADEFRIEASKFSVNNGNDLLGIICEGLEMIAQTETSDGQSLLAAGSISAITSKIKSFQ